mmetsp:Transcript_44686/g.127502  ORF Transcript_44686/g.127502 Transcript_44686/m.127502 type:complete len:216 (-) Transcript_44686:2111-2758(-)
MTLHRAGMARQPPSGCSLPERILKSVSTPTLLVEQSELSPCGRQTSCPSSMRRFRGGTANMPRPPGMSLCRKVTSVSIRAGDSSARALPQRCSAHRARSQRCRRNVSLFRSIPHFRMAEAPQETSMSTRLDLTRDLPDWVTTSMRTTKLPTVSRPSLSSPRMERPATMTTRASTAVKTHFSSQTTSSEPSMALAARSFSTWCILSTLATVFSPRL